MLADRNRQRDLWGFLALAVTAFLALALFTFDPADPPSPHVFPAHAKPHNWCGQAGAWTAHLMLEAIGVSAYFVLLSAAVLAGALFANHDINDRSLRLGGWLLTIAGLSTLAAMIAPGWSPGPAIGSGGHLGAVGQTLLHMHVANVGGYLLSISLLLGGLLLCSDYLVVRASAWLMTAPVSAVKRRAQRRTGKTLEKPAAGDSQLAVKIGGKQVSDVPVGTIADELDDDDSDDEEDDEDEDEDDQDEDEDDQDDGDEEDLDDAEDETEVAEATTTSTAPAAKSADSGELRVKNRNQKRDERLEVMRELDAADRVADDPADYQLPPIDLLLPNESFSFEEQEKEVRRKAKQLEKAFASFGLNVRVVEIETGPVIAQFEVELESGLRLAKITSLSDDLAIALRVPSVRIVAPIPGKNTVGIEVPNETRQLVRMREVIEEANGKAAKMKVPIYLGKDVAGNPMVADLASLPHLLIAGRTGTGKSVCLNTIIMSLLMTRRPDELRMLLIDPKMVELSPYKTLPHLMHPVVTDMKKAEAILAWAVEKMEERYALLARAGVRHISGYNQLGEEELMDRLQPESDDERQAIPTNLPYIIIVADEMADLMMTSAKEVETHIIRLAQKSRAVGIHLVLATQKPTVDVITGLIKSNLPARIAFQVASRTDSRVVLDEMGADKLLGNGDMLFLWPGTSTLIRGQGTYVSDEEINRVVECVGTTEPDFVKELVQLKSPGAEEAGPDRFKQRDELYEAAIDVIVREGRGSVSLLQRALGIGYGRGARLIDFMAEDGIVGPYNGSQAREVLVTVEQWQEMSGQAAGGGSPPPAAPAAPAKRSSNKIRPEPEPIDEPLDDDADSETDDYDATGYQDDEEQDDEEHDNDDHTWGAVDEESDIDKRAS